MKDNGPDEITFRTVRCKVCGYTVDAALQSEGKREATIDDLIRSHSFLEAVSIMLGLSLQDIPAAHTGADGWPCKGGPIHEG